MPAPDRYARSREWLARAQRITPGGAQTRSKMAQGFVEGAFPTHLERADGCRVWDVDGHEYIDLSMGLAAVGIGHGAIYLLGDICWIGSPSLSLPHPIEVEYGEALCHTLGYEQVRFVKTGSEATEAAMRIARVATGRDLVVSIGYHGWHSVHDAAADAHPGVPDAYDAAVLGWPWGEPLIHAGAKVAAVLVEPALHTPPPEGYLLGLRKWCDQYDALLVFDEVVTGFRWALGGAKEYFGVSPDLACFGKAMANGWPLAAVLGSRGVMEAGGRYISGTYGGEVLSLMAGKRTLEAYQERGVIGAIWRAGATLIMGFNAAARIHGAPYQLRGYPCKPYIYVTVDDPDRTWISLLLQEAAREGVLLHPTSLCVAAAHEGDGVREAVAGLERAMEAIVEGAKLEGLPSRPVFSRVTGPMS